jgi:pyridoxal phosphate enzyme (YggS family)
MEELSDRLDHLRIKIAAAAQRARRSPSDIELVAVSKTQPAEDVREAIEAGQLLFGENRVQELLSKAPLLPSSTRWHFIGHLQSNKIRKVLPICELIHGVDSSELAQDIDRIAGELGLFPRVLLEVNVAGEASKFGFKPEVLRDEIEALLSLKRVQVEGFMTIAPLAEDPEDSRTFFRALRTLRDELATCTDTPLPILSMGMSGDFEVAVEEGATHVRVGSALFGTRSKAK